MVTEEQFEENLNQMVNLLGIESLFSEKNRKDEYRPYFKTEEELEKWSNYEDEEGLKTVTINKIFLESLLDKLETAKAIDFYEVEGAEYKVRTPRYDIFLRLLHFGDVVQYTVNRKTNIKGNYARAMRRYAIQNNLEKYI
ncbi:hypothetical protein P9305_04150 [Lysinibacillus capsici]|uniref:hypothetical protein n=1 Tax=Lysinibacillus capsici TaxID=2115968 RepID=UPI002E203CB9|nr:hypothetical protein [Lysinibacillus capsici]